MARNSYFTQGTTNEQNLVEDIIIESMKIYGNDVFYIPRTLVSKDEILGEDRLSEFKESYPIEMYFENIDNFDGQGAMLQKFGLMVEQTATLVVSRKRWQQLIGNYGNTIIPSRPCEGDLIYFPLTKGLFEIKFVKHQDPFYQIGKLYVYKLQIELFQYASERIETGDPDIDVFESLKTFDTTKEADIDNPDSFGDNNKFKEESVNLFFDTNNPFGEVVTSTPYTIFKADSTAFDVDTDNTTADRN